MGSVKFIIDSDLIELVDAIGLDYEESKSQDDEIVIILDNVDELVGDINSYELLSDDELCSFLLNETLCEGLIYTDRSRLYVWRIGTSNNLVYDMSLILYCLCLMIRINC